MTSITAPGGDKLNNAVVVVIGIGLMAVIAGLNDNLGKILLVIMIGFLLIWLMTTGETDINHWLGL